MMRTLASPCHAALPADRMGNQMTARSQLVVSGHMAEFGPESTRMTLVQIRSFELWDGNTLL